MDWLEKIPRKNLGHWPTPLEPMTRLSAELGGPRLWIKRDDCSGLATGGNKTRKLEYLLADAARNDARNVVTFGAVQSNHARQTAAACARLGLPCHLVLSRRVPWDHPEYETSANVLIDELCGAELHIFEVDETPAASKALIADLERPYVIPAGGSNAVGALGYVRCATEIAAQAKSEQLNLKTVIHASASSGTQAGLVFGFGALSPDVRVLGVNVFHPDPATLEDRVANIVDEMAQNHPQASSNGSIEVLHDYVGDGYGLPTPQTIAAIRKAASLEGLLFDPVYSGKGLAGMIDLVERGKFAADEDVVFVHTGGTMSLSVYRNAF